MTVEEPIARLNERYAIVDIGSFKRDTVVIEFGHDGDVMCVREFTAFRRHLCQEPRVEVGTERIALATHWLGHPGARRYNRLAFAPDGSPTKLGRNDYNTWRGLAVKPHEGEWGLIRHHIAAVICGGNEEFERWLHNWIAAMVQHPGQHAWVALVLKGGQGTGKGTFADALLGSFFRKANYVHLMEGGQLTGRFNAQLQNRVLVFADEAMWGDRRRWIG